MSKDTKTAEDKANALTEYLRAARSNADKVLAIKFPKEFRENMGGIRRTVSQLLSVIDTLEERLSVTTNTLSESGSAEIARDAGRFRCLEACDHWTVENATGVRRYETGNGRTDSLASIADDLPDPRDGSTCTYSPAHRKNLTDA